jgi:hypothetical protein
VFLSEAEERAELAWYVRYRSVPADDASGCRLWIGARDRRGYGRMRRFERMHSPHRVALEGKLGRKLKGWEDACHTCDYPQCVEPEHLFAGSRSENMQDANRKGRAKPPGSVLRGAANPAAKMTAEKVLDVRARAATGERVKDIADSYGVSRRAVQMIVDRVTWAHVPEPECAAKRDSGPGVPESVGRR